MNETTAAEEIDSIRQEMFDAIAFIDSGNYAEARYSIDNALNNSISS